MYIYIYNLVPKELYIMYMSVVLYRHNLTSGQALELRCQNEFREKAQVLNGVNSATSSNHLRLKC